MLKSFFAVIILGLSTFLSASEPIVLVKDGKAKSVIVLPDKTNVMEEFAAKELQYHLERMSGAKVPIVHETALPTKGVSRIFIGQTAFAKKKGIHVKDLPPSGYIVKTNDRDLFLIGRDRIRMPEKYMHYWMWDYWRANWMGSLFAVYDLLEKEFGILWLWPGKLGESIPKRKTIVLGELDRTGKPIFQSVRFRVWKWTDWNGKYGWKAKKNRTKFYREQDIFRLRHRISVNVNVSQGHVFYNYWKWYGKSKPEYFAKLPDGTRRPLEGDPNGHNITMCVSNPELVDTIIANWKNKPARKIYMPYVPAGENDSPGMCVCDKCRAWDAPDSAFKTHPYWSKIPGRFPLKNSNRFQLTTVDWGEEGGSATEPVPSLTDRYVKFYNALAQKAKLVNPEAKVVGYAYANYINPPKETKVMDNVIIEYVPKTFFPYTKKQSEIQRREIQGWHDMGAKEFIYRPNYMFAGANLPLLWTRRLVEDVAFAVKNGATSLDFDGWGGAYAAQGPMMYAAMRLVVDPFRPLDEILDEYYSAFGAAKNEVRKYFDYWTKLTDNVTMKKYKQYSAKEKGLGFKNFIKIAPYLIKSKNFRAGFSLLRAAKKAAGNDKTVLARIEFLKKGLRDAELSTATARAKSIWDKYPKSKIARATFQEAFNAIAAYRASIEMDNICNYSHMACWEVGGSQWPWKRMSEK
jgi:hypothetical protein